MAMQSVSDRRDLDMAADTRRGRDTGGVTCGVASTDRDRDLIAEALPAYEVGHELGRGAFGRVFDARHRRLDRQVAVKQLGGAFAADPEMRARFLAEARLLAALDHPHVVPVHDFVEHEGLCLLVMEKLSGGTVWQTYKREGISMESACALLLASCAGLHSAHQKGVLHRDVKPDNLMFSAAGTLKVTDFGIAKVVEGATTARTQAGMILGTPAYMAPEQAEGSTLTPATDVYAAGTVLYELLSGALPFPDDGNPLAVLYRHVHDEPVDLAEVAPAVPGRIADVVMRSISTDPADRYPSAEAFGLALAAAATEAWGRRWLYPTGRILLAEGPILAMLQDAAAELPADVGSRTTVGPSAPPRARVATTDRPPSPERGTPPRSGRRVALFVGIAAAVAIAMVAVVVALGRSKSGPPASPGSPLNSAATGAATVRIDRVTRQGDAFLVFYSAQNFVPRLEAGNRHIHLFWNTVEPENAGANGRPPKPYAVYAGPVPFRGFKVADRPPDATQVCALVADDSNSVESGTGNCAALP
jgi:serine/threonine-protein kinase